MASMPDVFVVAAIFEQDRLAIRVKFSSAGKYISFYIYRELDKVTVDLEHLSNFLRRGSRIN